MRKKIWATITVGSIAVGLVACGGVGKAPQGQPQSAQQMSIVLESPGLGTASTPLSVKATASSPNGISGWVVYLDDSAAMTVNNSSSSLSASLPMNSGSHLLYVRVWDTTGTDFATSPTFQVNVQGSQATVSMPGSIAPNPSPQPAAAAPPPPPPSPLPSVPGNANVFTAIQNMDGWQSCSDCAGGGSTTSNFWTAGFQSSPSISGSSREFYVGGGAWANALWWNKVASSQNWASHFLWDFWVRFDSTSIKNAHGAEYDVWQIINGQEFMMGSQCNFESGVWDVWDSSNNAWKPTSIACARFSSDTWHHIQWYVERSGTNQYHYGVLVIDGKAFTLDRSYYTNSVGREDSVGVQFQLDEDSTGTALHEWVDNVKLSIW